MFIPFISQRSRRSRGSVHPNQSHIEARSQNLDEELEIVHIEPRKGGGGGGGGGKSGSSGSPKSSGSSSSGKRGSSSPPSGSSSSGKSGSSSPPSGSPPSGKSGSSSPPSGGPPSGKSGSSSPPSGSSSSGKSGSSSSPINTNTGNGQRPATVYGSGGGSVVLIPYGNPFGGRPAGGGTRSQIFGTNMYGSGYPGLYGRGTFGRGFPFYYWPVVWWGGAYYLHPAEYDSPTNTSRPGGVLATAAFSNSTLNSTVTVLRILSDNDTVTTLISQLIDSCSPYIHSPSDIRAQPYLNDSNGFPKPEQAIQYYRASSIVLSLDGYNNTATLIGGNDTDTNNTTVPSTPLPSNINLDFINCINSTIGSAAPLVDSGARSSRLTLPAPFFGLAWVLWVLIMLM